MDEIIEPHSEIDNQHPSPEQLLIRMALETLTPRQKQIWGMYNNDKMTHESIAERLHIKQQSVSMAISGIERKVQKFCRLHRGAYMLLKLDQRINEE